MCIKKEDEKCFSVYIPDLEIDTFAETYEKAKLMGTDALLATILSYEDHNQKIPKPSSISLIKGKKEYKDCMVVAASGDTLLYRRKIEKKAVRRNVTLPLWLDKLIREKHLNVSEFLQNALINTYNLKHTA